MSILVTPQNEQEEKVLIAFLESLHYHYETEASNLKEYTLEVEKANLEIENGDFLLQEEVEKLILQRRNAINGR
ncbi:MAG: hypothetical protein IE931_09040 [Sphingobacteriales bacterium]|nr:hypothetical protein [Sphingobacteriales bacterium]